MKLSQKLLFLFFVTSLLGIAQAANKTPLRKFVFITPRGNVAALTVTSDCKLLHQGLEIRSSSIASIHTSFAGCDHGAMSFTALSKDQDTPILAMGNLSWGERFQSAKDDFLKSTQTPKATNSVEFPYSFDPHYCGKLATGFLMIHWYGFAPSHYLDRNFGYCLYEEAALQPHHDHLSKSELMELANPMGFECEHPVQCQVSAPQENSQYLFNICSDIQSLQIFKHPTPSPSDITPIDHRLIRFDRRNTEYLWSWFVERGGHTRIQTLRTLTKPEFSEIIAEEIGLFSTDLEKKDLRIEWKNSATNTIYQGTCKAR